MMQLMKNMLLCYQQNDHRIFVNLSCDNVNFFYHMTMEAAFYAVQNTSSTKKFLNDTISAK